MYGRDPWPGGHGRPSPPIYPPVVKPTPVQESSFASAVLAMVDDPHNPKVATVYIGNALPPEDGYSIPTTIGVKLRMAPPFLAWVASNAYETGDFVKDSNGNSQQCIVAGTSGATAPTWATVAADTTTDGTVTWAMLASATSPPAGFAYYNNTTLLDGGSNVTVDVVNKVIVHIDNGVSSTPPADPSDLFQFIRHDGAYNTTGNFQNPGPIDVLQLSKNPSPGTNPVITGTAPSFVYSNEGASAFDISFNISLTVTNPPWLFGLNFYAVNHGAAAPTDATNPWSIISPASSTGTYSNVDLLGLTAGISNGWDIYVAFVDNAGGVSAPTLINTTLSNPQAILNSGFQGVPPAFAFSGTETGIAYQAINAGVCTATCTGALTVTDFGTTAPTLVSWLDHVSVQIAPTGQTTFSEVNVIPSKSFSSDTNVSPVSLGTVNIPGLGAGMAYDVKYRLVASDGSIIDSAVVFTTTPQYAGSSSLQSMPSAIKTNGPTISASSFTARVLGIGLIQLLTATFTETDFTATPAWIAKITLVGRITGTTNVTFERTISPQSSTSGTYSSTPFPVTTGDEIDLGLYYTDLQGQVSATAWPAGWAAITDPNGAYFDGGNSYKTPMHGRMSTGVQAALNASGQSLLVEFPGGYIGKDGALTNVDGVSSTQAYPLPAGTTITITAQIAKGSTAEANITLGNFTNGYDFYYDSAGHVYLYKYVAGVGTLLGSQVAVTNDTNWHSFRLTIKVLGASNNQLQGTWDGVDPNAGAIITDTSLDLTTGLWPITLYTGGSAGKVLNLHVTTADSHYLGLPSQARTALDSSGRVIGNIYDGTTALSPANLTNAITNTGLVKLSQANGDLPYANQSSEYQGNFYSTGLLKSTTLLNDLGICINNTAGNPGYSYTSTTTSITISIPSTTFTRSDLSTVTPSAYSHTFSSLTALTGYYFDMWYDAPSNTLGAAIYAGGAPSAATILADCYSAGRTVINGKVYIVTPGSGTGSGSGTPGSGGCPADYQMVETQERGLIRADELEVGIHLPHGTEWVRINGLERRPAPLWRYTVRDQDGDEESFDVNDSHASMSESGEWILVRDMVPGTILHGDVIVLDSHYIGKGHYIAMEVEGHVYSLGKSLAHNITL